MIGYIAIYVAGVMTGMIFACMIACKNYNGHYKFWKYKGLRSCVDNKLRR